MEVAPDVSIDDLAIQTAALVASDLVDLVSRGEHAQAKKAASGYADPSQRAISSFITSAFVGIRRTAMYLPRRAAY